MWFLQIDTLGLILLLALVYLLADRLLGRGRRRLTPLLLVFDLVLLLYVSRALTLFYLGYTLVSYLLVQWVRVCLPMQGTRIRFLVWEDPNFSWRLSSCPTTTGPVL